MSYLTPLHRGGEMVGVDKYFYYMSFPHFKVLTWIYGMDRRKMEPIKGSEFVQLYIITVIYHAKEKERVEKQYTLYHLI